MTACGICVKPNTWSKCEDAGLCAPCDVADRAMFFLRCDEDEIRRDRSIKLLMVRVRFNLFSLRQTEQFLPS